MTSPWAQWTVLCGMLLGTACDAQVGGATVDGSGNTTSGGNGVGGRPVGPGSGGSGTGSGSGAGGQVNAPPATTDSGVTLKGDPRYHEIVRLTHAQWENSIQTIFGLDSETGLVSTLYPDTRARQFSNNEDPLSVGSDLLPDYARAADTLAKRLSSDSTVLAELGGLTESNAFIAKLLRRAFRSTPSSEEVAKYQALWDLGASFFASGDDATDGARVVIEAVLQSPHFLYRNEIESPGTRLSGVTLATKLSLLLRDTIPDEALIDRAESGEFDDDTGLAGLAEELLDEDAAHEVFKRFHTELYGMDRYLNIHKSTTTFPGYTEDMNQTFLEADLMFFDLIYSDGGGLRDILTSNVAFTSDDTAHLYGIDAPGSGSELSEVTLDETRPGYLTRTGFLAVNATLSQPDPIHRGVSINNKMLCADLAPPVGGVPPLPEPRTDQTNRQRVDDHTNDGSCAGCHTKIINPLGFAFEHFDGLGKYRTEDNGQPVNAADVYAFSDGDRAFEDATELIDILASHPQAHGCYSAKVAEFVLGRDVAGTEKAIVDGMAKKSMDGDASIRDLVLTMVRDPLFTTAQGAAK